jgi:putative membrane protein insertion efficiency factor
MRDLLKLIIKFYQKAISPLFPPNCRFYPTCSHYAVESLEKHGAFWGGWLAVKRIVRCNPLNPGGIDPVPDEINKSFFKNIKDYKKTT